MAVRNFLPGSRQGEYQEYSGLPDEVLWDKLRAADKEAFSIIYKRYFPKLFNYGRKLLHEKEMVQDCIHDLFVSLWRSRGNLSATSSVKFYLYACLKRQIALQTKRKSVFSADRFFHQAGKEFELVPSPEEDLILAQTERRRMEKLLRTINKLSARQKEVLFLRYYEGLSTKEVAAIMSLNINSTYVLLSKALDFLKKHRHKLISLIVATFLPCLHSTAALSCFS